MASKKNKIVDKWALDDYEPQVLTKFEKTLSIKINYTNAYKILAAVLDEMGQECHDTYIFFARRCKKWCGTCVSRMLNGRHEHRITLYKGYYTLGVLLHEYAHALVYQMTPSVEEEDHGKYFQYWFVKLSEFANILHKIEPELFEI